MNDRIQLRFDGMMKDFIAMGLPPFQYTEVDPTLASYGATFYCKSQDEIEVSLRREEKRVQFEEGLKK